MPQNHSKARREQRKAEATIRQLAYEQLSDQEKQSRNPKKVTKESQ